MVVMEDYLSEREHYMQKADYYEEKFFDEDDFDEEDSSDNFSPLSDAAILVNDEDFLKNFSGDLGKFASECIVNFFQDKEMHYGGPIPQKMILRDNYIKMVANSNICDDVDRAYKILEGSGIKSESINENIIADDVRLILQILDKCKDARIPKCFRGGLILMYLEFCEGIEVN